MKLEWGYLRPEGSILAGVGEFPDHRRLASEYFSAYGTPESGDEEASALSAGWIAFVIDADELRLKISRVPAEEDYSGAMRRAIWATEVISEQYSIHPAIITLQVFTAPGVPQSYVPEEPEEVPDYEVDEIEIGGDGPEHEGVVRVHVNPRRRRKRNAAYWGSGPYTFSWGFVNPQKRKVIDGMPMPDVTTHEELASKITKISDGEEAYRTMMNSGWMRYYASESAFSSQIALESRMLYRNDPEKMINAIMVALRLVVNHTDLEPSMFIVDVGDYSVSGTSTSTIRRKLESHLLDQ